MYFAPYFHCRATQATKLTVLALTRVLDYSCVKVVILLTTQAKSSFSS